MRRSLAVALSVLSFAAAAEPPRLELSTHVVVDDGPVEFGGLSGVAVRDDGMGALVLSDRGKLFAVSFRRDAEFGLERVVLLQTRFLYMYGPDLRVDTEGLARGADGEIYVSTEDPPTVLMFAPRSNKPRRIIPFPRLGIRNNNRWLEALAVDQSGRPVTMTERPPEGTSHFSVFRFENNRWDVIAKLDDRDSFAAVGADFGPDGLLYVLERAVSPLGFRSRIRRVDLSETEAEPEIILETRLNEFDNLEGISLWTDSIGQVRILLVSDNNFLSLQRTEFVEFILRE